MKKKIKAPDEQHLRYSKIDFPPYRFIPGETLHPTENPHGHSYGKEDEDPGILDEKSWYENETYLFGVDLHDLRGASIILGVYAQWILQQEDPWEMSGYVSNVVFTCGAIPEEDGSVKIYWGGADSVMCVGTANINDLIDLCLSSPRKPL